MDRRQLLKRGAFFTVAAATGALAACGDSFEPSGTFQFAQGVASGDPRGTSLVFWTRCVRADGGTADVAVQLHASTRADFSDVVAHTSLVAGAAWDNTVRAKITGLPAATPLYYRFVAGTDISAVGRSKTTPSASATVAQLKFGWFTCQDWSINHWGAMSLLAAEDLDFLVHVGDYVYETVGASFQVGAAEPAHTALALPDGTALGGAKYATTLADYRYLYRTYRSDARLRTLHQQWPLIAIRDDHVVSEAAIAQAQGHDPVNGSDSVGARYFVQQPVLAQFDALKTQGLGRPSSILGTAQTQWWTDTISASTAMWSSR